MNIKQLQSLGEYCFNMAEQIKSAQEIEVPFLEKKESEDEKSEEESEESSEEEEESESEEDEKEFDVDEELEKERFLEMCEERGDISEYESYLFREYCEEPLEEVKELLLDVNKREVMIEEWDQLEKTETMEADEVWKEDLEEEEEAVVDYKRTILRGTNSRYKDSLSDNEVEEMYSIKYPFHLLLDSQNMKMNWKMQKNKSS